jgi:hypothetical protein
LAILFVITALSACTKVELRDSEWCGDAGEFGAYCFNHLTEKSRELTKEQWDFERFGQVCTTSDTFANWKAVIEKLCAQSKRCKYEEQKMIEDFFSKIDDTTSKTIMQQTAH